MNYLKIILASFLIATAFSVAGVFLLQAVNLVGTADTDLKNLPYGIAVGCNVFLAFGTLPIFLNLKAEVRTHMLLSALSFLLLPMAVVGYIAFSLKDEAWTVLLFCLPYLLVLSVFFMRHRNQNKV